MMAARADLLFMHMRATSSMLHSKSDKELMERMKRYLVDESEAAGADGGSGPAVGVRSSFGSPGTTSFSPKKPKGPDTRPAILARRGWVITIDKKRKIVSISGESVIFL
jgi:dihydropteroate synthase